MTTRTPPKSIRPLLALFAVGLGAYTAGTVAGILVSTPAGRLWSLIVAWWDAASPFGC